MSKCPDATVLLTIGRMNSPHEGHLVLIDKLISDAREKNLSRVNIVLSATVDSEKNPLGCEHKRMLLYQVLEARGHDFESIWIEIVCMDDPTPESRGKNPILKSINEILSHYSNPQNIILVVGEDRATDFNWISNYITSSSNIPIEFQFISRPEGSMSATYLRGLVTSGNFSEFSEKMTPLQFSESQVEELYHDLQRALSGGGRKMLKKRRKSKSKKRKTKKSRSKKYKTKKLLRK